MEHKRILLVEIICQLLIITAAVIGTLASFKNYNEMGDLTVYNNARILVKDELYALENGREFDTPYLYTVVDINGCVVKEEPRLNTYNNKKANINELLQLDKSFYNKNENYVKAVFALKNKDCINAFAVFLIPKSEAIEKSDIECIMYIFLPLIIAITIIIVISTIKIIYVKIKILKPIRHISKSANAIIAGDYSIEVVTNSKLKEIDDEIGELTYAFELMRDEIRERAQAENSLKRAQKELISCISHDLKTPISTIKAYSEGVRDGLAKDIDSQKRYAEIIVNKAEILNKMITDLLEHSNAELNELKIYKKEQYFKQYIDKTADEIKLLLENKGYKFIYESCGDNVLIEFDQNRITQVINNLIENSIKYTDSSKGIIKLIYKSDVLDGYVKITVADNGLGISTEDILYVFDKFYRAEKSRSMSIPGSGLGLSICKYIVEQHGGEIKCKSINPKGSEFSFTLKI